MAPEPDIHADLAAYLTGKLAPPERARFEAHLDGCPECREEVAALAPTARALEDVAPEFEPPADLRANVLAAVEVAATAEAATPRAPADSPRVRRRRPLLPRFPRPVALGMAGALALAVFVGVRIGDGGSGGGNGPLLAGPVEIEGEMTGPGDVNEGEVVVRRQDSGRAVLFRSTALPVLPKGEYYELWFVGPGDSPSDPNRIPAGTFHPDEQGNTDVLLHAAVDPALFPRVQITAQSGPGDPEEVGPVVASLVARDLGSKP